ncbi:DNA-binding response regulator, LuxR family [Actinokineospora spheciospongiae]|uniref:DNA-binding response regulator, LuxR family n=1 Tax=Actinokineospora spheciospongiae TaxID=909613 RepID=W7IR81_9PSEU|nr:LuxR C-terminal-related transcriptional regulator [Actinokineospora spheciospongiae]EWC59102.1 DNA-binding response regulator, LuxR family [Actinokineospora spheciospongiae]
MVPDSPTPAAGAPDGELRGTGRTRLGVELTRCVGRRREVAEARRLLGSGRLVTLAGPGGVGKTRLAALVAQEAAPDHRDGVLLVELAELRDGASQADLVAQLLGLRAQSGRSATGRVLDHLRERAVLLVLDNCEHLVDDCATFVHRVLTACPRVAVLATSRQSLGVPGEQVLRVPPLSVPGPGDTPPLELLARYDGVRLFVDRATAVHPGFRITEGNRADVARLCGRLDGLPLAIELAAARIQGLSPRQISERLGNSLALLTNGSRTAPERQQTLRTTVDWSHGLCSEVERLVWARLSVFAGSFDLAAAEHVCAGSGVDAAAVCGVVDALVDKSVLQRVEVDDGDARYRMLQALREYGHERLERSGALGGVLRGHRDWFDRLTHLADARWAGPEQSRWARRLRWEQANLRAALGWSVAEPGQAGVALRMAARVDEHWTLLGLDAEAQRWLDRALAAAPADHPDRPFALATAALHALWCCDLEAASASLTEAERLAAAIGDDLLTAQITSVRVLEVMLRRDPRAADLAEECVPVLRAHGDLRRELRTLALHGIIAAYNGDLGTGREKLRRVIALGEAGGGSHYRDMALFGLALIEVKFGDVGAAAAAARTALASSTLDSPFGDAFHLETLAWAACKRDQHERAATLFGAAATAWELLASPIAHLVARPHREFTEITRQALGDRRFDSAHSRGRALPPERARRHALDDTPAPGPERNPLSKREREVAGLVARGLSNRDIAARLLISPRTAETHVQHILVKLDFTKRSQIAVWVTLRQDETAETTGGDAPPAA